MLILKELWKPILLFPSMLPASSVWSLYILMVETTVYKLPIDGSHVVNFPHIYILFQYFFFNIKLFKIK